MKKTVILIVIAILAASALLTWWSFRQRGVSSSREAITEDTSVSRPSDGSQTRIVQQTKAHAPPTKPIRQAPAAQTDSVQAGSTSNEEVRVFVERTMADPSYEWRRPINFHGKVVDEQNQPVAGAGVDFTWNDLSPEGTSKAKTSSDEFGLFSLRNKTGKGLSVKVRASGYYTPQNEWIRSFEYANPADGLFKPDPKNPVVFHLRKKGQAEPLIVVKRQFRIPKDGTPVEIDLLTGQKATAGGGSIKIECWTSARTQETGKQYDWKCRVSVPSGGLAESPPEFAFEAPSQGYRQFDEINMPHTLERQQWSSSAERKYFLRLANGYYARMTFRMIGGGGHFCVIESYVNPAGSRNLEYDPEVQPKPKFQE